MHRILTEDGGYHCFACGAYAEEEDALQAVACKPGGWAHPPYLLGLDRDGSPMVETCAAHPYAGCEVDGLAEPERRSA